MAKKITDADPAIQDPKHNVKNRETLIRNSMEQLYQEDLAIEAALDTHIRPHREEKGEIKARLRNDLELTTAVINARYSVYKLQRKAEQNDDANTQDLIRELFDIVPLGGTVDMIDALQNN